MLKWRSWIFQIGPAIAFLFTLSQALQNNFNSTEHFFSRQHLWIIWFQRIKSDVFPLCLSSVGKIRFIQNLYVWHFLFNFVFSRIFVDFFFRLSLFLITKSSKSQICLICSNDNLARISLITFNFVFYKISLSKN